MADEFTGAAYNDDDIIKKYGSIENHQRILKDYRDHLSGKKPEKPTEQ